MENFFVPISEISLLKKGLNLYKNLYEKNFNTNIIVNKKEMEYLYKENFISKYRKQFNFEQKEEYNLEIEKHDIEVLKDVIVPSLKGKLITDLTTLFSKIDSTSFSSKN